MYLVIHYAEIITVFSSVLFTSSGTVNNVYAVLEGVRFVHGILAFLHVYEHIIWKLRPPTFCLKPAHHILFIVDIASLHKSCQVN